MQDDFASCNRGAELRVVPLESLRMRAKCRREQLVDIPRYPAWMPQDRLFVTCKDSEGPVGVGTTYSDRTRLGTVRGEVAVFHRPYGVVFHYRARLLGMDVMEGWPGHALVRDGDAITTVHHRAEGHLHGPFKLMQPLIRLIALRERRRTVNALRESLESARCE